MYLLLKPITAKQALKKREQATRKETETTPVAPYRDAL